MSVRRGKAPAGPGKEPIEEGRPRVPSVSEKPKASEGASVWGKPKEMTIPRIQASPSSSSTNGLAKSKALAKTTINIAALAARNLGGFVPNKIFVGGVPITCTDEQFKSYFEPFGAISKVELHALRGFGYITYESVEAVDACLEKYQDHYLSKKWVEVKRSIPRELIDSYEKEQRRLTAELYAAEHGSTSGGGSASSSVDGHHKVEVLPASPVMASAAAPASASAAPRPAWGRPVNSKEPNSTAMMSRITQLKEMGFSEEVARRVLSECVWDVNKAIDRLLTSDEFTMDNSGVNDRIDGPETQVSPPMMPAVAEDVEGIPPAVVGSSCPVATCSSPSTPAPPLVPSPDNSPRGTGANLGVDVADTCEPASGNDGRASPSANASSTFPVSLVEEPVEVDLVPNDSDSIGSIPTTVPAHKSGAPPRKRIERVQTKWNAVDPSQMSVSESEFVNVWIGTATDNGWIHAERRSGDAQAGWLPLCVLHQLPDNQRWMCTRDKWQAMDESQCDVEEGTTLVVWVNSKTSEGWTYVEVQQCGGIMQPGWLPVFCLDWNED